MKAFFLAVKQQHAAGQKSTNIGIFALKQKDIPYAVTEKFQGNVHYFAWEPNQPRFGVIHGPTNQPKTVSFYHVQKTGKCIKLFDMPERKVNQIHFSPIGYRCLLVSINPDRRGDNVPLEFVDLKKNGTETVVQHHKGCKEIHWDPSGRYVVTAVTQPLDSQRGDDTGYKVWSFQGAELFEHRVEYFYQFLWRPRPRSMLTKREKEEAMEKLAEYAEIFEKHDEVKRRHFESDWIRNNIEKMEKWQERINELKDKKDEILAIRQKLRGGYAAHGRPEDYSSTVVEEEFTIDYRKHNISQEIVERILQGEKINFDSQNTRSTSARQTSLRPPAAP